MEAQGFVRDEGGIYRLPENGSVLMELPAELMPKCPEVIRDRAICIDGDIGQVLESLCACND